MTIATQSGASVQEAPALALPNTLWGLFKLAAEGRWLVVFFMYFMPLVDNAIFASIPFVSKHIVDAAVAVKVAGGAMGEVVHWLWVLMVLLVAQVFGGGVSWWLSYYGRLPMQAGLAKKIFAYTQRHSTRYFDNSLTGKVAYRANVCAEQVFSVAEQFRWTYLPTVVFAGTTLFYFYLVNPWFAVALFGWLAVYVYITMTMARRLAKLSQARSESKAQVTGRMVDSITNIKNVLFQAAHREEDRLVGEAIDGELGRNRVLFLGIITMSYVQKGMNTLFYFLAYTVCIYGLLKGYLTPGDFLLVVMLSVTFLRNMYEVGRQFIDFFDVYGSALDSINTIIVPHELIDAPSAKPLVVTSGEVRFEKVSFAYNDKTPIFADFNLTIRAGEKVGLIGHSGAGKSTIASLLMRLYDVQGGGIYVDGQNVTDVTQESLRRAVALIPQDTLLFHRTMLDNIRYARPEATLEEVMEAAKRAHADDFIATLPKGYDTLVGERGVKLSGGQRQRVAIARAILKQSPILLLDEATSALDSESEAAVQQAMQDIMVGKTVIAIAHRLSTIAHLDRLIVLEGGKVVEDGSHSELLAKGGVYARLWARQSGGFLVED